MRKSRLSEEQIVAVLQEWDAGAKLPDLVRRHGVTEQTLYRWKKKYGGLQASEAKRLKALELLGDSTSTASVLPICELCVM
jgi:putative transposase